MLWMVFRAEEDAEMQDDHHYTHIFTMGKTVRVVTYEGHYQFRDETHRKFITPPCAGPLCLMRIVCSTCSADSWTYVTDKTQLIAKHQDVITERGERVITKATRSKGRPNRIRIMNECRPGAFTRSIYGESASVDGLDYNSIGLL